MAKRPNPYEAAQMAVNRLKGELTRIDSKLTTMTTQIDDINGRLKVMSTQLNEIEKAVSAVHKSVVK